MSEDSKQVAESIRSGDYFAQSRLWYQTLYIGPIAERSFFLIIAILSSVVAIFSIVAVFGLTPLTNRPGLVINSARPDDVVPVPAQILRTGQELNVGMRDFFIRNYVVLRESYAAATFAGNTNFIRAHSDEPTFASFDATYNIANPRSPAAILGEAGTRNVTIESVRTDDTAEPKSATVVFSTDLTGISGGTKSRWTATLQYYYTDLLVTFAPDPQTGENVMTTQDPQFQVVNYALTQLP